MQSQRGKDETHPTPAEKWNVDEFALIGAAFGTLAAMGYEILEASFNDVMRQDFFLQIVLEMAVAGLAGAVLFGAIAAFRNRRMQG